MVRTRQVSPANSMTKLRKPTCKPIYRRKKKLFVGLGSVRIAKNCDFGLENAALGLRPRAAFSRLRSQFFPTRSSQPAHNIYKCIYIQYMRFFKTIGSSFISIFSKTNGANVIIRYPKLTAKYAPTIL